MSKSDYRMGFLPAALCETDKYPLWDFSAGHSTNRLGKPKRLKNTVYVTPSDPALTAFEGNCDPHITEADCRKAPPASDAIVRFRWPSFMAPERLDAEPMPSLAWFTPDGRTLYPDADGWYPHDGGAMPCEPGMKIWVRLGTGGEAEPDARFPASDWRWSRSDSDGDIVAWKPA